MNIASRFAVCIGWSLLGCGPSHHEPARAPVSDRAGQASAATAPSVPGRTPPTRVSEHPIEERKELAAELAAEGVTGTIALFDTDSGRLTCSDAERCRKPHLPASTFKIPNTIIALENGIVTDAETVLPWDGKEYAVRDWNQDLTLRAAIRVSCVPCFQELARRIGEERMREWVARLDFGNRDTAGGIDRFWLTGALRITAVEELDFLSRLDQGKLPIQSFTRDAVIDMLTVDVGDDYVLRGKTGLLGPPDNPERIGWFVGWVEKGNRRVYFATLLDGHGAEIDLARARRRVTERVLARLGVLGS